MSRSRAVALIAGFLTMGIARAAHAQPIIPNDLMPAQPATYKYQGGDDEMYIFRCTVPALSLGVVTVARTVGDNNSQHNVEVADRVYRDNDGEIVSDQVITENSKADAFPKVLWIPFSPHDQDHFVIVRPQDDIPAEYHVYCDNVNLLQQMMWAGIKTTLVHIFRENAPAELADNNTISRALNLMTSLAWRDSVMAVGVDAFKEEVIIALEKQFPDNPDLVTFLAAFTGDIIQKGYEHAFYEMSGYR